MGILKNLFGGSGKGKEKLEEKPRITKEKPDFATRSISADLRGQIGKEPWEFTAEDFAKIREVHVSGIWNEKPQRLYLQELQLLPNLEKIFFTKVNFCPRDMYQIRQLKAKNLKTLIFEECYFADALRLEDVYERFEIINCRYKRDFRFWGNYPNLRELVFRGDRGETLDFRFLEKLVNLRHLEICGIGLTDGECLSHVHTLESLALYDTNVLCEEVLGCGSLKKVQVWEPLYRELMQEQEEGKTKLEILPEQETSPEEQGSR